MTELKLKHRLCFPFCGDLGNKKIKEQDLDNQMNINWSLFRIKQHTTFMGEGAIDLPNSDIRVPGNYSIERVRGNWTSAWSDPEYTTFIAPDDYYNNGSLFYKNSRTIYIDLPNELEEQPHLHKHSTFQFYYLKNILFSASCQYLGCDDGKVKAVVGVYASPSGTYFYLESGIIFFKWKVEVRQDIVVMNLVKEQLLDMWNTSKKIGKGVLKFATMGAIDLTNDNSKDLIERMATEVGGKDHWKKMGLDKEKIQRNQEKQMERMITSNIINEATLEPPILYTDAIKFPYNLFDYALRSFTPQWQSRIYISENLFNNLIHNNNQNPITYPLNITFERLGNILRPGYWQGELTLEHDSEDRMKQKFKEGITFYEDKVKEFVNPILGVKSVTNQMVNTRMGGDIYSAQTITEPEAWTLPVNRSKGSNYHQRGHYFIFYEDGSTEHWMALYPLASSCNFNQVLVDDHTHGAFVLEFDKPVKKMIDIYTCIGCGAQNTPLFDALNSNYRNNNSDSLETIHKGLPFEPWFSAMEAATAPNYDLTVDGVAGRLGGQGDVWEKATQEVPDKTFNRAYGFIAGDNMITWRLSGESSRIKLQKVLGHNDFDNLDWNPPLGSGGEIEIPLNEPDIAMPEPDADNALPENDPTPDIDISGGGEPEISIEPDIAIEPDTLEDEFDPPEIDVPEVDITPDVPDTDPTDTDPRDNDVPDNDGDIPLDVPEGDNNDHE